MDQRELTELIREAVPAGAGGRWADLGAGDGNFTVALATLLGPAAQITAVDTDFAALERLSARLPAAQIQVADFRQPLTLESLDGVLMANSLHFVHDKAPVLARVFALLRPGGRLALVEYETDRGNPWVPHPLSYRTWERLATEAGFTGTRLAGTRPSRYFGSMYAAVSFRPA